MSSWLTQFSSCEELVSQVAADVVERGSSQFFSFFHHAFLTPSLSDRRIQSGESVAALNQGIRRNTGRLHALIVSLERELDPSARTERMFVISHPFPTSKPALTLSVPPVNLIGELTSWHL
jgi:hypothetical protein